jgi:3-oxoacyl-[acyl-carrier-protein] synthase II
MAEGFIPPTLNLDEVDERCAMIQHSMRLTERRVRTAAIQNFAFGGVNTCLMLRNFEG